MTQHDALEQVRNGFFRLAAGPTSDGPSSTVEYPYYPVEYPVEYPYYPVYPYKVCGLKSPYKGGPV